MVRRLLHILSLVAVASLPLAAVASTTVPVGYISFDVTTPPNEAQFDIANETGGNGSGDPSFPVTNTIGFSNLSLTVNFATGPSEVFGSSYFTLGADGISFDGTALSSVTSPPSGLFGAQSAVLSGKFTVTSFNLFDGTTFLADPNFSATISDPTGLTDGDIGIISANQGTPVGPSPVPEPETLAMVGSGLAGLIGARRRRWMPAARELAARLRPRPTGLLTMVVLSLGSSIFASVLLSASVRLNAYTTPTTGAAGSTVVSLTGSGFPAGGLTPAFITVSLSTTCNGPGATTTTATNVRPVIGSVDRIYFEVPSQLNAGNYFASVSGTSTNGTSFSSASCSEIAVTHTSAALAACLPSSSLGVISGTNVTAYVPKGFWSGGTSGIKVVPIEGSATASTIFTPSTVNSCSANSQTGDVVCVANNKDVYRIRGSLLTTTLQSGSDSFAGFSGGECQNCGVAINALTNTAVISMGATGGSSGDGLQLLNLANNSFAPVFPTDASVSEDVSIDPNRNLILSPNERNVYDLFKISPTGALTEYENQISSAGEMDSAAEDCTTGIALASLEFTGSLYITDLSQTTFTDPIAGANHGTWTAPAQVVAFPEFRNFSAGTDGISVAAGTTHLGIVSGEFGGNTFGVFKLPATSGTGTPAFVDYAAAILPTTPDTNYFSAGYDPHTITAYTSPNNGKAYGLIVDWALGTPSYVAVIDIQALLNAPRQTGSHNVLSTYDLIANGVIRYIATP